MLSISIWMSKSMSSLKLAGRGLPCLFPSTSASLAMKNPFMLKTWHSKDSSFVTRDLRQARNHGASRATGAGGHQGHVAQLPLLQEPRVLRVVPEPLQGKTIDREDMLRARKIWYVDKGLR